MKQMSIVWKRLVKGGETCTRCGKTGQPDGDFDVASGQMRNIVRQQHLRTCAVRLGPGASESRFLQLIGPALRVRPMRNWRHTLGTTQTGNGQGNERKPDRAIPRPMQPAGRCSSPSGPSSISWTCPHWAFPKESYGLPTPSFTGDAT